MKNEKKKILFSFHFLRTLLKENLRTTRAIRKNKNNNKLKRSVKRLEMPDIVAQNTRRAGNIIRLKKKK